MKIVVLLKEVPDTYGERKLNLETGLTERDSENVVDEISERALEVALAYADAHEGTDVSVLTLGPASATASVRKGLAMGAASATHIVDDGLLGADLGLTSEALAAAIKAQGFDLVIAGNASTDGSSGMLPVMLAEHLGVAALTNLSAVAIGDVAVTGTRQTDAAQQQVSTVLPAVISITEALPDARFPNFKGIMAAKKKPLEVKSLTDLGIDPNDMTPSRTIMLAVSERPLREAGVTVTNENGDAAKQLVAFLTSNRLV